MFPCKTAAPLIAAGAIMLGGASTANAVVIPGTSDPWLAGMPNGSTASSGDTAPAESPVLVPGLTLSAGEVLTFSATGSVSNVPSPSGLTPDGSNVVTFHSAGAQNGIADLTAPFNSLVGVFLSAAQPSLSAAPSGLDFPASGTSFTSLSPELQQPFFIGDGLTGKGTGAVQGFVVPTGATRLFLGTMDAYGWDNNSGSFDVAVSIGGGTPTPTPIPTPTPTPTPAPGPASVPEPATAPLLAGILAGFLLLRRRSASE